MNAIHEQANGRQAEYNTKQIVFLKCIVMTGMVGFMPYPKKAMHDVFMGPPCHKLPK